ncbi:hypothetical protein [Ruminococcus sp.]|uniref:hypothetical protein n=1 Tax=Ruminococcus sp. TaxID=41978 RepID=UPI0025D9773D|nr:hypothetical protein [Ruminococcus sp.]
MKRKIISAITISLGCCLAITGTTLVSAYHSGLLSEPDEKSESQASISFQEEGVCDDDAQNNETSFRSLKIATAPEIATKDEIYYMMLNSIDYYDSISGTVYFSCGDDMRIINSVQFQCVLSNMSAYEHYTQFYSNGDMTCTLTNVTEEVSLFSTDEMIWDKEIYCSDRAMIVADNQDETFQDESFNAISLESACAIENSERISVAEDGEPCYQYRTNPTNLPDASLCLFPQEMAFGFLTEQSLWEIDGIENLNGRNCYHINGHTTEDYGNKLNVETFEFLVDCNTGVLLQYIGYDCDGEISDYLYTEDVQFEDEAETVTAFSENMITGYTEVAQY